MNTQSINISSEIIAKETEKAICIRMSGEYWGGGRNDGNQMGFDMWIPKSLVKENEVPMWFLLKAGREKHFASINFYGCKLGVKC
jgi:hypothetical protein